MANKVYKGRGAIPGVAEGIAMVSEETIQGWAGVDENTGMVVEKGHPFEGMSISGNILILSGGKGSNGWSCHFHAASVKGIGPAGFIFPKMDSRTGVAAVVTGVPTVTDLEVDPLTAIKTGDRIRIDGTNGTVEILSE